MVDPLFGSRGFFRSCISFRELSSSLGSADCGRNRFGDREPCLGQVRRQSWRKSTLGQEVILEPASLTTDTPGG